MALRALVYDYQKKKNLEHLNMMLIKGSMIANIGY